MTYCIYHIPGKKIGVTNDPERRITCQQGYAEDEYDILAVSDDIDYISELEIELQNCLLYTSPSPRDGLLSRMPSSA